MDWLGVWNTDFIENVWSLLHYTVFLLEVYADVVHYQAISVYSPFMHQHIVWVVQEYITTSKVQMNG